MFLRLGNDFKDLRIIKERERLNLRVDDASFIEFGKLKHPLDDASFIEFGKLKHPKFVLCYVNFGSQSKALNSHER